MLGQLLRVTEGGGIPPSILATAGGAAGTETGGAPPISPGEYAVSADVQVTFELK